MGWESEGKGSTGRLVGSPRSSGKGVLSKRPDVSSVESGYTDVRLDEHGVKLHCGVDSLAVSGALDCPSPPVIPVPER